MNILGSELCWSCKEKGNEPSPIKICEHRFFGVAIIASPDFRLSESSCKSSTDVNVQPPRMAIYAIGCPTCEGRVTESDIALAILDAKETKVNVYCL